MLLLMKRPVVVITMGGVFVLQNLYSMLQYSLF